MGTMNPETNKPFSHARGIDNLPPPLQFSLAVGVFFFFESTIFCKRQL
jgi:hypothetical protein